MADDPVQRLAKLRIIKASADLEVQLAGMVGASPTIEILRKLQERAAESLAALAFINIQDPAELPKALTLQNEVKRYDEWLEWIRELIAEGKQYDQEITADEREEMLDLLTETPEGEQEAISLGLLDEIPRDA
jgi:hypothetical protein